MGDLADCHWPARPSAQVLQLPCAGGDSAQHPGEPRLVHTVHPLPGRGRSGVCMRVHVPPSPPRVSAGRRLSPVVRRLRLFPVSPPRRAVQCAIGQAACGLLVCSGSSPRAIRKTSDSTCVSGGSCFSHWFSCTLALMRTGHTQPSHNVVHAHTHTSVARVHL